MSASPDILGDTLKWVNATRLEYALGPPLDAMPRGIKDDPNRCPVAQALEGANVSTYSISLYDFNDIGEPNSVVQEFMERFDGGSYPELIA